MSDDTLDVKMVRVDQLVPDPSNPRNNSAAVSAVAASIRQFGFKVPLIVSAENGIIAGHTRYRAALMEGLDEVPCVVADDLTEDQQKALAVAENRTSDFAFFDTDKLSDFVKDVPEDLLAAFDVEGLIMPEQDGESTVTNREPEKRKGLELAPFEKYQYVTIICRNEHDYLNLTQRLGLENRQRAYIDGVLQAGSTIGRVIEYPDFYDRMAEEQA